MPKTICILPLDTTTEFLRPVFDEICRLDEVEGLCGDTLEDEFYERFVQLLEEPDLSQVVFLGHGSKTELYGTCLKSAIVDNSNYYLFANKRLLIFSCYSNIFLKNLTPSQSIGFGFIPTALDDVRDGRHLHDLDLSLLSCADLDVLKEAIVSIWHETLSESDLSDYHRFKNKFVLYTNNIIVDLLTNNPDDQKRLVADVLFYLKDDMVVIA